MHGAGGGRAAGGGGYGGVAGRGVGGPGGDWAWCRGLEIPTPVCVVDATAAVGQHLEVWRDHWSILTDCPNLLPPDGASAALLLARAPRMAWSPAAGIVAGADLCGAAEWAAVVSWSRPEDTGTSTTAVPIGWRSLSAAASWVVTAEVVLPSDDDPGPAPAWALCIDGVGRVLARDGLSLVHVGRALSGEEHRRGLRLLLPLLVTLSMVRTGEVRLERTGTLPPWGPSFGATPVRVDVHPEDRSGLR